LAAKPNPRIDATSRPFWEACNSSRLLIQQCTSPQCKRFIYYPRVCCPHCQEGDLKWIEASGAGEVATHTTIHRTHHDGFNDDVPFIFAAIRLAEGPIIYGRLGNAPTDGSSLVGRSVRAIFEQHAPEQKLVAFQLT
jgi:uncharacterized OB-fold protein